MAEPGNETTTNAESALVPSARPKEFGALRKGGNVQLSAREKKVARAGRRFLREKLIPRSLRILAELLEDDDPRIRLRAVQNVLDRGGLPRRQEIDASLGDAFFTPDLVAKAMKRAAEEAIADPSRGDVVAIDAEFEVVPKQNGGSPTVQ